MSFFKKIVVGFCFILLIPSIHASVYKQKIDYVFNVDGEKITLSIYEDRWGTYISGDDNSFAVGWNSYYGAQLVNWYAPTIVDFVIAECERLNIDVTNSRYSMGAELQGHVFLYMIGEREQSNPADIELNY